MITFYNAGAGSGKTHALSNELAKFLIEDKGKPSEVILTTFSNKSAEELKERVRKALLEKNEAAKAAEMSNALIGTVNAICSKLVSRYAMEIGISPELRVLDEESTLFYFNQFINNDVPEPTVLELNRLCNKFGIFETKEDGLANQIDSLKPDWPGIVKNLAGRFRAYNFDKSFVEKSKKEAVLYARDFLITRSGFSISEIWRQIKNTYDVVFTGQPLVKDIATLDGLYKLRKMMNEPDDAVYADFACVGKGIGVKSAKANDWLDSLCTACFEYHRTEEFALDYTNLISLIYDTAFNLIDGYQRFKQQRGLIDFADQELLFLSMLQTNETVRREIKATFKLVMVDEFQDSSPIQLAIFNLLKDYVANAVWVGDPKQAIYGFRDSDSELFRIALDQVQSDKKNTIKSLPNSFRSRPGIVSFTNDVFTGIFKGLLREEHIVLEPSKHIKEIDSRKPGYADPAVQVQFFQDNKLEDYYSSIGMYIQSVLQSGMVVYDKSTNGFRKIRGGDIALLFRTNSATQSAAASLRAQGILVSCEADGLQQQAETLWLTCLLRLLINPDDSLAIANLAILQYAVGGVEDIMAKRLAVMEGTDKNEKWSEVSSVAKKVISQQALLEQMPLTQVVSHLITVSELARYCMQWGNSEQRMSTINKVMELAAGYQEQSAITGHASTLSGFIDQLSNTHALPPSQNTEAVTIMTVHKAKGLEWPMVIAVKLGMADDDCRVVFNTIHVQQPSKMDPNNLLSGQTIIYLPWPFGSTKKVVKISDVLEVNKQALNDRLNALRKFQLEEDRLLYVALTRARDYLILPYFKKESGCCIESEKRSNPTGIMDTDDWSQLEAKATFLPAVVKLKGHTIKVQMFEPFDTDLMNEIGRKDEDAVVYYNVEEQYVGHSHALRHNLPSSRETFGGVTIRELDFEQTRLPMNKIKNSSDAQTGSFIHAAFASWKPESKQEQRATMVKNILHQFGLTGILDPDELDTQFLNFWNYIQKKYKPIRVIKELPLAQVTKNNGAITKGFADLVIETKYGLILIDHKTFPGSFAMALDKDHELYAGQYASQLNTYKGLLEASTGKEVIAMLLHYVVQGRIIEIEDAGINVAIDRNLVTNNL